MYFLGTRMLTSLLIASFMVPGTVDPLSDPSAIEPVSVSSSLHRLSPPEISARLQKLPDWTTDGNSLFYTRTFEDFVDAIAFVNSLVEPAEHLGHHPDITINYNRVTLQLTTHEANGLTELDFQLASQISHFE